MSSSGYVIDKKQLTVSATLQLPASQRWLQALRPASEYRAKDIGKTFWPPMNAQLRVKVPAVRSTEVYGYSWYFKKHLTHYF